MNTGECPYAGCIELFALPVSPDGVRYQQHECTGCGRVIWTRLSRFDSWSMTQAAFHQAYTVDEATKSIAPRTPGDN